MLRLIFVFVIIILGVIFAVQGPFYALLFYLWNAYFRPEYWVWTDYVSPLNLSLIVGVFLLLTSLRVIGNFRWSWQTVLIVLFLIQSLISLLAAEHRDWSFAWWTDFAKVLIITLLITFLVTDRQRYRLTLLVIAYSLGFETAKQGWAGMVLHPGGTNANPNLMLGDNNGVATGMMMLLPLFIALSQTATRRWERYLHRFFIVGVLYRGLSTYSRGGFLAGAAVGLVMLAYARHRVRAFLSVAILAGLVVSVMPQAFWDRMETINAPAEGRNESSEGRLFMWQVGVRMADAKPLAGIGFNGFERSFAAYDTSGGAWGKNRAVHSAWFGVLAEMGYPGLILFVSIIVVALSSSWRIRHRTRRNPAMNDLNSYAAAMQMSLVAYVVGVTFLSGQYLEMFWHFIGLGVALERIYYAELHAAAATPGEKRPVEVPPRTDTRPRVSALRAETLRLP